MLIFESDAVLTVSHCQDQHHDQQMHILASNEAVMRALNAATHQAVHQASKNCQSEIAKMGYNLKGHVAQEIRSLRNEVLIQLSAPNHSSKTAHPSFSLSFARMHLVLTIPRLGLSIQDINLMLRKLADEVATLLSVFLAVFGAQLANLIGLLPQIIATYQVLCRLPRLLASSARDAISFEDALGRTSALAFSDFRYWDVFQSRLICTFKETLANHDVTSGRFTLTTPRLSGVFLDGDNWARVVTPGMKVLMAIDMDRADLYNNECPRCGSTKNSLVKMGERQCSSCSLSILSCLDRKSMCLRLEEQREEEAEAEDQRMIPRPQHSGWETVPKKTRRRQRRRLHDMDRTSEAWTPDVEAEKLKVFKRVNVRPPDPEKQTDFHFGYPLHRVMARTEEPFDSATILTEGLRLITESS